MPADPFAPPPGLPPRSAWSRDCSACGACCTAPDIAALGKGLHTPCRNLRAQGGRELCAVYLVRPGVCRGYTPDWVCGEVSPLPTLLARSRRFLALYGFREGTGPMGRHQAAGSTLGSMNERLVTVIVLDSVGLGALPDAASFGDEGSHTLNHTLRESGVGLPHLAALGLARVPGVDLHADTVRGAYGRMREVSRGKDSTTGHWELMGAPLAHPFRTYPEGFPAEVMQAFDAATGRGHLVNLPYSGTEVLRDHGEEHLRTGYPIVYTSADSVFQIAAHVDAVPLETLYAWSEAARELLQGEHAVARVIARPFEGEPGDFRRLDAQRHDYSVTPPRTVLNALEEAGHPVHAVGKINDLYGGSGVTAHTPSADNADGIAHLTRLMGQGSGLLYANLVDFDSKYGHRRDPQGYGAALAQFDAALPGLLARVRENDLLLIVSDHGNDPTWPGSDHTREYGLLLAYRPGMNPTDLGERGSFADVGATVAQALGVAWEGSGVGFWRELGGEA